MNKIGVIIMIDTTPLKNLIKPQIEKINELEKQAQQLREESAVFYNQAKEKEAIINKKIFKKKQQLEEIRLLYKKQEDLYNESFELDRERSALQEKYIYPIQKLIKELDWDNYMSLRDGFSRYERTEEEYIKNIGSQQEYLSSTTCPDIERPYRIAYDAYNKLPCPEVKTILDELEDIFSSKYPLKWEKVYSELFEARIKNTPKPKTDDYDLNPNLFIETPPVNTYMTDIRTGKWIYYQDGKYTDENGNTVPLTYAD